jgi:hypothetical protein
VTGEGTVYVGKPKEMLTMRLFDASGRDRVYVELGESSPRLTVYDESQPEEGKIGIYVINPSTGTLEHRKNIADGSIPWLQHRMTKIVLPISLVDQRGNVLWKSTER